MILWHDNVVNSNLDYEDLVSKIMIDKYYVDNLDIHTTYQHGSSSPDNILIPFYSGVMEQLMSDLGLYHRSRYLFNIWTQIYSGNNNSAHNAHCHFSETNILSWVHFIKPPEKNCFCFIDSWGKEHFPESQRQNDFIVFPSWALHKAVPFVSTEKRIIVAGNIRLESLMKY